MDTKRFEHERTKDHRGHVLALGSLIMTLIVSLIGNLTTYLAAQSSKANIRREYADRFEYYYNDSGTCHSLLEDIRAIGEKLNEISQECNKSLNYTQQITNKTNAAGGKLTTQGKSLVTPKSDPLCDLYSGFAMAMDSRKVSISKLTQNHRDIQSCQRVLWNVRDKFYHIGSSD